MQLQGLQGLITTPQVSATNIIMSPSIDKNASILIVGAGTFGLSTAYHLAKAGYNNITVLEKGSEIPAPFSAGYDLNKIVRAEYEDPFYAGLALVNLLHI